MSATELWKAAGTLRDRSTAAFAPPWTRTGEKGSPWDDLVKNDADWSLVADCDTSEENAAYIATVHPGVGLALAEWLNVAARHVASHDCEANCAYPDGCGSTKGALAVARLINGTVA